MNSKTSTSPYALTILTENDGVPGSYFDHDPSEYTVEQLKRWLKCRGLKLSGKRDDLVKRVSDAIRSGNHRSLDVSIDDGKWFAAKVLKDSQKTECTRQSNTQIPVIPLTGWDNFQSRDIPPYFNYGHIYHYALESIKTVPAAAKDDVDEDDHGLGHMTDKPLKNARKYVDSGFVHDVMDAKSEEHYFLRAHVWPSMRTDLPHNVFVVLSNTSGAVIHGSCEPCKVAALGRCSHVVAVLLHVLDHAEKHGHAATAVCTSKPCSWNKGKKRNKTPKRLSDTDYSCKRKKSEVKLIDFDPRPKTHRKVTKQHINGLVRNLQRIYAKRSNEISMWEVQLQITYDDYPLEDEISENLKRKTKILEDNLKPDALMEIPGTRDQSSSEEWHNQKFRRLTASKCLTACKIGELVHNEAPGAAVRAYSFIKSNVWKLGSSFQSFWMKYGLESEPKAINKYEDQTKVKVCQTGLWVNPKFPFLGCSPDGLVNDKGLVEIKSLKIFKNNSIEDITSGKVLLPKDTINRQCFAIKDGKCVLRPKHVYYYQVQMQLLVTERDFCDFLLYAEEGVSPLRESTEMNLLLLRSYPTLLPCGIECLRQRFLRCEFPEVCTPLFYH